MKRFHVFGASGSGTTSFGRGLASSLSIPHHDTDDYYWVPTDPPFQEKRPIPKRLSLMKEMFLPLESWVLSGSLVSWSETVIPYFDAVIFVSLDNDIRLKRVEQREEQRYGKAALQPGGARHEAYKAFLEWNGLYEDPDFDGRSRAVHERWLNSLDCPVYRIDSSNSVDEMIKDFLSKLV